MSSQFRCKFPLVILLCIIVALAAGCPDPLGQYTVAVTKDVVYALGNVSDGGDPPVYQDKELLADVYEPVESTAVQKPAVLLVHGGSFTEGSKEKEQIVEYANYFASYGYVAFAISYRLRDDYPPAPDYWDTVSLTAAVHAAIVDTKAAVRFIRANANAYGLDPQKIGLLGESAGAIAGVTAAVTDPGEYEADGPEFPVPELNYPDVSPRVQAYIHLWGGADHVLLDMDSQDPPIMIVHGDEDDEIFTPFSGAERLNFFCELLSIPHVFYRAEGYDHGAWDYRYRGDGITRLALDFLNEHLLGIAGDK